MKFRLGEILADRKISKSELSELTDISRNSISLLSLGHSDGIKFENLYKISEVLEISIGQLFEQEKYDEIYIKANKYDAIKRTIMNMEDKQND
ncbi:helix-turn-helix transcriptional regulator [Staphylococcus saprophyticus]|nr:helix-turn-helix transcriptional regulator [Staphylococcus saprophyticus]